jgi:hypothetical protein
LFELKYHQGDHCGVKGNIRLVADAIFVKNIIHTEFGKLKEASILFSGNKGAGEPFSEKKNRL